jgi:hypothetical protein
MREPPHDLPPTANAETAEGESSHDQSTQTANPPELDGRLQGPVHLADSELVMGVERQLLEQFLSLIRDCYDKVDKATFFLEMRTGKINVSGIKNVRGILSHLVMFLDPNAPPQKREAQLIRAEGHMRRAITEPYEVALDSLTVEFEETYERYKKEVLPVKESHGALHSAPNSVSVEARLQEIRQLGSKGRDAKDKALWTPEWDSGVSCFVDAFEKLFSLKSEIEGHCNTYDSLKKSERLTRLHFFGIAIGILGIIATVLLVVIPGLSEWIRSLPHAVLHLVR